MAVPEFEYILTSKSLPKWLRSYSAETIHDLSGLQKEQGQGRLVSPSCPLNYLSPEWSTQNLTHAVFKMGNWSFREPWVSDLGNAHSRYRARKTVPKDAEEEYGLWTGGPEPKESQGSLERRKWDSVPEETRGSFSFSGFSGPQTQLTESFMMSFILLGLKWVSVPFCQHSPVNRSLHKFGRDCCKLLRAGVPLSCLPLCP